jgi:hypothetical protein
MNGCDNKGRGRKPAHLVKQEAWGPCGGPYMRQERFVFRLYLCRYCLAAHNRERLRDGKAKTVPVAWRPDDDILHNAEARRESDEASGCKEKSI